MLYIWIRSLRVDADLRQADLALYLNCSRACYSSYENGTRDMPRDLLCHLADFYNTSVDYLLHRTDVKTPYSPALDNMFL